MKAARILTVVVTVIILISMTVGSYALAAATTKPLATNFTLVNLSATPATATIYYILENGTNWKPADTAPIAANGGQVIFRQYSDATLPSGRGSVMVTSDQALAGLVQQVVSPGSPAVPTSGAYTALTSGSNTFYVPLIGRNASSATGQAKGQIVTQNLGANPVDITVSLYPLGSTTVALSIPVLDIPANASNFVDLTEQSLADGWYYAVVDAQDGGSIGVVVNLFFGNDSLMSFNAFSDNDLSSSWKIPLLYSRLANSLNTSLAIQNMGATTIPANDLTVSCTPGDGETDGPFSFTISSAIAGQGVYTLNTLQDPVNFPTDWFGPCSITSGTGKNISTLVMYRWVNTSDQAAYGAIPGTSTNTKVIVPLVAKRLSNGFSTVVTVMNLSNQPALATITYVPSGGGSPIVRTNVPISANGSIIRNFRTSGTELPEITDGWVGTMTIDADKPIAAYVANTYLAPVGDQFMAYTGFTLP